MNKNKPWKKTLSVVLALAMLMSLLPLYPVEVKAEGEKIINASSLADNTVLTLDQHTILNMDVDKTLKYISGKDYFLTIQGDKTLTVNRISEGDAIDVNNIDINAPVDVTALQGVGIRAKQGCNISTNAEIKGLYGIYTYNFTQTGGKTKVIGTEYNGIYANANFYVTGGEAEVTGKAAGVYAGVGGGSFKIAEGAKLMTTGSSGAGIRTIYPTIEIMGTVVSNSLQGAGVFAGSNGEYADVKVYETGKLTVDGYEGGLQCDYLWLDGPTNITSTNGYGIYSHANIYITADTKVDSKKYGIESAFWLSIDGGTSEVTSSESYGVYCEYLAVGKGATLKSKGNKRGIHVVYRESALYGTVEAEGDSECGYYCGGGSSAMEIYGSFTAKSKQGTGIEKHGSGGLIIIQQSADVIIESNGDGITANYVRILGNLKSSSSNGKAINAGQALQKQGKGLKILSPDGATWGEKSILDSSGNPVKSTEIQCEAQVTFDNNGYGKPITAQKLKSGSKATRPADPSETGMTFDGWYTKPDCSEDSEYDFDTILTGDITLYAKWSRAVYTITFDLNGAGGTAPAAQSVNWGDTAAKPEDPTKTNAEFGGWYNGNTKYDFSTPVTANVTLKAKWHEYKTVTFDAGNGSGTMLPDTVLSGSRYTLPECEFTAPAGHYFLYWRIGYVNKNPGATITIDDSIIVEAVWRGYTTYTVTFDSNGYGTAPVAQTIRDGMTASNPTSPSASGVEFMGWYTYKFNLNNRNDYYMYDFNTPVTSDVTLYAAWKDTAKYSVSFGYVDQDLTATLSTGGGQPSENGVVVEVGDTITLTVTEKNDYYELATASNVVGYDHNSNPFQVITASKARNYFTNDPSNSKVYTYTFKMDIRNRTSDSPGGRDLVIDVRSKQRSDHTHNMVWYDEKPHTCTTDGTKKYGKCTQCGHYFKWDENEYYRTDISQWDGTKWIPAAYQITDEAAHTYVHEDARDATCSREGNIEHYKCSACNKRFSRSMQGVYYEITIDDVTIPADTEEHDWYNTQYEYLPDSMEFKAYRICKNDGNHIQTEIVDIDPTKTEYDVEPTCTQQGIATVYAKAFANPAFDASTAYRSNVTIPAKGHTMVYHDTVPATEVKTGKRAYYECSVCHKIFYDAYGSDEADEDYLVIAKQDHMLEYHSKKAATCTTAGKEEYYSCMGCDKLFADKEGKTVVTEKELVIPVAGHTLEHHVKVEAEATKDGTIEYWECTVCGKMFSDEAATKEVTDIIIQKTGGSTTDEKGEKSGGGGTGGSGGGGGGGAGGGAGGSGGSTDSGNDTEKDKANAPVTEKTTNPDGSVTETTKTTNADGSKTEKQKTTSTDGTIKESEKTTATDGTIKETEKTTATDGTVTEKSSVIAADGSATISETVSGKDGSSSATTVTVGTDGKAKNIVATETSSSKDKQTVSYDVKDGKATVSSVETSTGKVIIPSKVVAADGKTYAVTGLDKVSFKGQKLKELTLPDSVKIIQPKVLQNTGLKILNITGKKIKLKKNCLKNTDKKLVINVTTKAEKKNIKKQLKKAGNPKAKVKVVKNKKK